MFLSHPYWNLRTSGWRTHTCSPHNQVEGRLGEVCHQPVPLLCPAHWHEAYNHSGSGNTGCGYDGHFSGSPEGQALFPVTHNTLNSFSLPTLAGGRGCYCPRFTGEEMEVERNVMTYGKSHDEQEREAGAEAKPCSSREQDLILPLCPLA